MPIRLRAAAILLGMVLPLPLHAAEAADDGGEIVVTGRGLADTPAIPAYDVQEIDREALMATASGRIEDALAGMTRDQVHAAQQVLVRVAKAHAAPDARLKVGR